MSHAFDLFSLNGRTAMMTEATRGIERSLALALAGAGADIVWVQRDSANTITKLAIEALGRKFTIYVADLSSASDIGGLSKQVLDGGHGFSILIDCGGIQRRHAAHKFPDSD